MKDDFRYKDSPSIGSSISCDRKEAIENNWEEMKKMTLPLHQPPYAPVELSMANAGLATRGVCTECGNNTLFPNTIVCLKCTVYKNKASIVQGTKHDEGKPDLSLVSSELMTALAEVRAFGANKYSRDNWKKGFKYTRSIAAALRHIMAFKDGEDNDGESGLTHIAHAIASLEHLLYDYKHHKSNDDRKG